MQQGRHTKGVLDFKVPQRAVLTIGIDGTRRDFEIKYTFGVTPSQPTLISDQVVLKLSFSAE